MTIAVTGASGHIGNVVCRELIQRGYRAKALIHQNTLPLKGLDLTVASGDLLDIDSMCSFVQGCDSVIHLAALVSIDGAHGGEVKKINVQGTATLIEAMRKTGVKRLLYVSSIHAHISPGAGGQMNETSPLSIEHGSAYDQSKAKAELLVTTIRKEGFETTIINPTAVVGPYDFKPGFTGELILRLAHRKIPMLTPGGFDWVDVRDVAHAAVDVIDRKIWNNKFLLSGRWRTLRDFAEISCQAAGVSKIPGVVPFWLAYLGLPFVQSWNRLRGEPLLYTRESLRTIIESCPDVSSEKAVETLSWNPRQLEESIHDALNWFRQQKMRL